MKTRALALALALTFLFSAAAEAQFTCVTSANFISETPPPGIQINSDGNVEGTNMLSRTGNVYTFTGNIYTTIVILRDNTILDGAGYTLQGKGNSTGIFLQDRSDVTITNLTIKNFSCGIKSVRGDSPPMAPKNIVISRNILTQNTYGIVEASPGGCTVTNNDITNNTYGASFYSGNTFRNNRLDNNEYCFDYNGYIGNNDIDTSNTVNGKPIYFWFDQHDKTVPSDAGLVILYNCSVIKAENLNLENNGNGLLLFNTYSSTIEGNALTNNKEGISLWQSSNNTISRNRIADNKGYGISGSHSTNNVISKNQITLNGNGGMTFDSGNNVITENYIAENGGNGIFLSDIKNSNVIGNNVTMNKGCGIGFGYGPGGKVEGNIISKNGLGIWISNAFENTIKYNNVQENNGWAVYLEGDQKNNIIHHNNFINSTIVEGLQVYIKMIWSYPGLHFKGPPSQAPPPVLVAGAGNAWDDGREGNYWSDYTARYLNASEVGYTGVGNTPYFINENNSDRFPLTKPLAIPQLTLESVILLAPTPELPDVEPDNSTLPNQQNENLAGKGLPLEYAFVITSAAAVVGVATASTVLLLRHRKLKAKT
jgi:parallel beta-helix repeat protein